MKTLFVVALFVVSFNEFLADTLDERSKLNKLIAAIENDNATIVASLIKEGMNMNRQFDNGQTPIRMAAEKGKTDVVKALIERGADLNIQDSDGWAPIHIATENGFVDIAKNLIEKGANVKITSHNGWTPLHFAAANGYVEIAKSLIEKGVNIEAKNDDGYTPLHWAAYNGNTDVAKYLIEKGANGSIGGGNGSTPLHGAAFRGYKEIAKLILEKGVDVNVKNFNGWTPLHSSAFNGHLDVLKYLVEKGADINIKNNDGHTPLNLAAENGNTNVVKYLIGKGAKSNAKGNNGLTVYNLALGRPHGAAVSGTDSSKPHDEYNQTNTRTPSEWIITSVALILILIISLIYLYLRMKRKSQLIQKFKAIELENFELGNAEGINPNLKLDEQADLLPYDKRYEFPREKLKLGTKLGGGAFGIVYKGIAHGILAYEEKTTVAVKMVKRMSNDEIMRALVLELKIMVHLGQHLNLVNLLGAVTKDILKYNMMIIVEYCRYGCLQSILIKSRSSFIDQIDHNTDTITSNAHLSMKMQPCEGTSECVNTNSFQSDQKSVSNSLYWRYSNDVENSQDRISYDVSASNKESESESIPQITTTDLICWSFQITRGMHYLASRKVLHGDLAARNILLCHNNVIKICDFGLARSLYANEIYHKKEEALLPFKWLALECISDHVFSVHTDVWAFGIVLWELFSLGMTPYPGLSSGEDLYKKLLDGYRMEKPKYATQDIYDIMLSCWRVNPELRPLFDDLEQSILKLLDANVADHYIQLNEPYLQANVKSFECGKTDYVALMTVPDSEAPYAPTYQNI